MGSSTESSLLSKLQSSTDLTDIHTLFSNYLHQFNAHLAPKKPSSKPSKTVDTTTIRSLAKQFLPFLSKSLSILPKRLSSEAASTSPDKISQGCAIKLLEVYRLCLSCLGSITSQLQCKPYDIQVQQARLIHSLEAWNFYKEAETEGLLVLESLKGINCGKLASKSVKLKSRLVPILNEENLDQDFALLVVEIVVTLVKCVSMNQSKEEADYKRVLALVDEATPWFKVLDAKAYEKLHRLLVGYLNKIVLYLVEEATFFDQELVLEFCRVTFSEYGKSSIKDQIYKFSWRICYCLFSKKGSQVSYTVDVLKFLLSSMASECELKVDSTITEFLELVQYCAKSCQTAPPAVCSVVGEHLSGLAGSQDIPFVGSIMGLYATGLLIFASDCQSRIGESTNQRYAKDGCGSGFVLDYQEVLQQVPVYLDLMKEFFGSGGNENGLSEKQTSYLLSYYSSLKFLCQPLAEVIYAERKEILAEITGASFITNLGIIQDALQQFCYIVLHFPSAGEKSNASVKCASDDNAKVISHISVATVTLSLKTGHYIKESMNFVKDVISSDWVQDNGLKYLFASLYNVAVVLYRKKQVKEASKALKLSCKASWKRVLYHCKSNEFEADISEDSCRVFLAEAEDLVNEASEKTAFLLDLLYERSRYKMNRQLKDSLETWCIAENMFKSLPPPLALVKHWVKIEHVKNVDVEHSTASLYHLISSSVNVSKRALGVLLEQELLAYKALKALNSRFCLKMQIEIMDTLLEKIYVYKDTYIHKSRVLIAKGAELREFGIQRLDECIQCLSDAIFLLKDICAENSKCDCQALHLMACAYCLRACCTHERTEASSKVLLLKRNFEDIHNAVNLWLNPYQSPTVNQLNTFEDILKFFHDNDQYDILFEDISKLLYHVLDLLSIKGYTEIHEDIYEILIRLFKWKKLPLEEALAMLWKSRRVGHSLCASPVSEIFISKLLQHYGELPNCIGFWIKCMQPSAALLAGFQHRFFSILPVSLQGSFSEESLETKYDGFKPTATIHTFHGYIEELKLAASDLISSVPLSSTAVFLSAYLYYDLTESLIMKGQLIEGLSYAKEAHQLRSKLLQQKFMCSVENQSDINGETEDGTRKHCYTLGKFQMHDSVAIQTWIHCPPCDFEGCILTPWNVLQCYLESTLQVANIHEILGDALEAETLLLWGKDIALHRCLPLYVISFSSMLGKLYSKQMLWELAEKELKAASQMMADNCNMISCLKCRMFLECTIYEQLGDLSKSRSSSNKGNSSVEMLSYAVEKYRYALQKLSIFELDDSVRSVVDANSKQAEYRAGSSFFNCSVDPLDTRELPSKCERPEAKTRKKGGRKTKKDGKPLSTHGECFVAGHHLRMTRSRYRSLEKSCESVSSNVQCGPAMKSNNDQLFACADAHNQGGLASETNTTFAESACEISRLCNKMKCWHCLALEVLKSRSLTGLMHMNWDLLRRRISLVLLIDIGQCYGAFDNSHKAHQISLLSISLLVDPFCPKYSSGSCISSIDLINKDMPGDVLAVEHAMLLYSICRISLKSYSYKFISKENGCQFSCIGIPRIFSWLKLAFVLSCEVPLLSQKVSRLLAVLYVLSTSVKAFSLPSVEVLSESHWASFFHQASIGTHFNQQLFSTLMRKPKVKATTDLEGSCLSSSNSVSLSLLNSLRLAPESLEDINEFVTRFFQGLPCTTIICISVLGGDDASLLGELLSCASARAWVLLSRMNSKSQPAFILLPVESILEEVSVDGIGSSSCISVEGKDFLEWSCPWVSTVVDEIAPIFKSLLKDNYLSSVFPKEDTKRNRSLWWSQREKLDHCLGTFLQDLEDSWFGPWKYLLLGEWSEKQHVVEKKLMDDLMLKCKVHVDKDLLEVILGGAKYASEIRERGLQLVLNKGCYIGGCCEALSNASDEAKSLSIEVFKLIFETDNALDETEILSRKPVTLVLDSEVQMLPWESIPVLRNEEVYRMPSVSSICATIFRWGHQQEQLRKHAEVFPLIDPLDSFYVLNPSGDLSSTQVQFENWFKDQKFEGKTGTVPTIEELVMALKIHDLFIYIGHGSGSQYIPGHKIQKLNSCAASLLMGCSSGSLTVSGCYAPHGTPLCYILAGSPVTVANLWEVTDKDIDRFGKTMLDAWLRERSVVSVKCAECDVLLEKFGSINISGTTGNGKEKRSRNKSPDSCDVANTCTHRPKIGSFMGQARKACNLPFLIGASPVCYGVPTGIAKKKEL